MRRVAVLLVVVVLAALAAVALRGGPDGSPAPQRTARHSDTAPGPGGASRPSGSPTSAQQRSAGRYTGGWHQSLSGNQVPDDCRAWARSSSNPRSPSDGLDLCLNGG